MRFMRTEQRAASQQARSWLRQLGGSTLGPFNVVLMILREQSVLLPSRFAEGDVVPSGLWEAILRKS
jgi:hypothetical protein